MFIKSIFRAISPETITSDDSFSTIEDLPSSDSSSDPFLCYNILATINTNNLSEQNSLMTSIQFDEELNDVSKLAENKCRDMIMFNTLDQNSRSVLNQSLTNVCANKIKISYEQNDNTDFIDEGMNQNSSLGEESVGKSQKQDNNISICKVNDNQDTMSKLDEVQQSSDDNANVLIDSDNNKLSNNKIVKNDNNSFLLSSNTSGTVDYTDYTHTNSTEISSSISNIFSHNEFIEDVDYESLPDKVNYNKIVNDINEEEISSIDSHLSDFVSEKVEYDNYKRMASEFESGNKPNLSFFDDDDNMEGIQTYFTNNKDEKESINNGSDNEIMDEEVIRQKYYEITLSLKDQLTLYNKFREIIPECIRRPVEDIVGIISFTYHQPDIHIDQTDDICQKNVTADHMRDPQEVDDSDFPSRQNQESEQKSTKTMTGYNYFVKKQFKKSRNESHARNVIRLSAKKWRELPDNRKKHYRKKAKRLREKVSIKQNRQEEGSNKLYSQKQQRPRQPRIDTPGEGESELLAVVIPKVSLSSLIPKVSMY